jgi:CRP-like cAMP-binding protein
MGTASSVVQLSPRGSVIDENYTGVSYKGDRGSVKQRNVKRIFDHQETTYDMDINSLLDGDFVDEANRTLLRNALSGFFFLQSSAEEVNPKMDLLIKGMKREEFAAGFTLITEGESGSKLYVVESGTLEVTINGSLIRELSKGHMLGELALLYDAPRSATIQTKTPCVLWSLRREIFKRIQAISATANQLQRARWLIASPDLAVLSPIELSRLVGTLQKTQYNPGDVIFKEGELSNLVVLIEKGHAKITSTHTFSANASKKEIDKELCIFRPRDGKRRSVDNMNAGQLEQYLTNLNDTVGDEENVHDAIVDDGTPALVEVYEGCMLGIAGLRGKAGLDKAWKWVKNGKTEGAEPPLTMKASSKVTCLTFTVDVFENLFGPVSTALQKGVKPSHVEEQKPANKEMIFDSTKFKAKYILGSGSFGVVTLAEYRPDKSQPAVNYALKSLSKLAVIETGQIRHVLDERKLLSIMDSIFILRLFGTYQTPHQLVMVTEPLQCGDLWSVIYETPPFCDNCGIPFSLAVFYTACLVHALTHIHGKGVVFRDLKPENIMLDDKGYLRVIDFGFSKRVPYTKTEASGEVKVFNKTYTLCGTPGTVFAKVSFY